MTISPVRADPFTLKKRQSYDSMTADLADESQLDLLNRALHGHDEGADARA